MIVVATDAPVDARQLNRIAKRATLALGRTGSSMANGSGDYVIAFSTVRTENNTLLHDEQLSPLFQAAVEATEEAIHNSLLKATDTKGYRGSVVHALPIDKLTEVLRKYGRLK